MNKNLLLGVFAGALALAGVAVWMLTSEQPAESGGSTLHRARDVAEEPPSFHDTAGEKPTPPSKPVQVEALPAAADAPAITPAAAKGPVRRITGRVVRLSDDTPLGGAVVARVVKGEAGDNSPAPGSDTTSAEVGKAEIGNAEVGHAKNGDAADGSFTLTDVPVDETEVRVTFNHGWPRKPATYPLPQVAGDIENLTLTYDSGFVLAGRVTDSAGNPLAGATASIDDHTVVTTDDAGRFELRDVAPGKDRLSVDVWAQAPWFVRDTRAVNAPPDSRQLAHVELQLQGSGAIEGRVTDPRGDAVPDCEVRITASMNSMHGQAGARHLATTTGADGHYRLDHVQEGRYLVQVGTDAFAASGAVNRETLMRESDKRTEVNAAEAGDRRRAPGGFAPRWVPDVEVQVGAATTLDVELDKGAIIEGRVTDASGARLAGSKVTLERLMRWPAPDQTGSAISFDGTTTITSRSGDRDMEGSVGQTVLSITERTAETGADGSYRFEVVSAGDKRIAAIDSEQRCSPQTVELVVVHTEAHSAVDFVLAFGLSLRGRVTDPGGAPLEGASANVRPEGTQLFTNEGVVYSDADGWFEVVGLKEGPHSMMLNKQGYSFRFENVLPGDVPRTWVLSPAPQVHGVVYDAVTGDPVLRFSTTIATENSVAQSGDDDHPGGAFTLDVDNDSPCAISISAIGYETETKEGVIPSLTANAPLQFRLKPAP